MVAKEHERWDQSAVLHLSWWYSGSGCAGDSRSGGNGASHLQHSFHPVSVLCLGLDSVTKM